MSTDAESLEDVSYITPGRNVNIFGYQIFECGFICFSIVQIHSISLVDVEEEVPEELSELKEVMERFMTMETTRGSGRDRGGEGEFEEGVFAEEDNSNERLRSGSQQQKEDAFADDEGGNEVNY